jgi:hypothetical protein
MMIEAVPAVTPRSPGYEGASAGNSRMGRGNAQSLARCSLTQAFAARSMRRLAILQSSPTGRSSSTGRGHGGMRDRGAATINGDLQSQGLAPDPGPSAKERVHDPMG